ncbi:hypothetical protein [Marinobacter sp.]|uniref:hypothetical protein n=1 Tax=Marinobacter sp. TaxID=50741 RepID=UPI00384CAE38
MMPFWLTLTIQAVVTALVVLAVLAGFFRWVLRPYLDQKIREIIEAADDLEPRITRGVKAGLSDSLRELPESTVRDSTRQFLRFGSDLFENGLSSFLGSSEELQKRSGRSAPPSGPDSQP